MDREELLNNLSGSEPAYADPEPVDAPTGIDNDTQTGTDPDPDASTCEAQPNAPAFDGRGLMESEGVSALLDALTVPSRNEKGHFQSRDHQTPSGAADGQPPAGDAAEAAEAANAPAVASPGDKTRHDEADAIIAEVGIKSQRGQERVRAMVAARKEAESKAAELETKASEHEQDINQFRQVMRETGLSPEQFGNMLEFGRLSNSGSPADREVAFGMLEAQYKALAKELGKDVAGIDPLEDFPELKQAMESKEITRERAIQLAAYQRRDRAAAATRQAEQARNQDMQQFRQQIEQVKSTAESYFATRSHEVDYQARINRISEYLRTGDNLQKFVQTYTPGQYLAQLQFMYDHISVAAPAQATVQRPLRSRSTPTGAHVPGGQIDNAANIASHMDALGI